MADEECAIHNRDESYYCHHNEEIVAVEEEIVTEINQFDDENTGTEVSISQIVELETPLESASSHSGLTSSSDGVKPKRLSDEFSNDENDCEESPKENNQNSDERKDAPSCINLCFNGRNNLFVQSIDDAIERADFEQEQKLTGGIIIRTSSLASHVGKSNGDDERLNFDLLRSRSDNEPTSSAVVVDATESTSRRNELTSTPTSSRNAENNLRCNKSTISQNRSSSAKQKLSDKYVLSSMTDYDNNSINNNIGESSRSNINHRSSVNNSDNKLVEASSTSEHSSHSSGGRVKINLFDEEPSTSAGSIGRHKRHVSREEENPIDCLKLNDDYMDSANHDLSDELDHEDTWADCEEGSDIEEICTCRNDSDDEYGASSSSSEDELPSRDVDLSSYIQLDPISDDILEACDGTPKIQRKRKLTEQSSMLHVTAESPITTNRKRLALDTITSPHSNLLSPVTSSVTPKSSLQRTPRLIPTKENPPPELMDWLLTFQRWTNAERLVAVDKLIDQCEPSQVRYMMKVIEPQFQRDFISLLPKELALHVLAYLDPRDLLRAAQTCRSWRFLADDNLLWKEKCKGTGIISDTQPEKPKRGRTGNMPKIASQWKAAYMRHHTIEMNWRTNAIRTPKVLNGHDDHVITCLQFSGNRIVSGSDDNTLKVWSAVSGKCLRTLVGHTGGVWSSQMSGNLIISGSTDRTLKIWDSESGSCKHTLYGHTSTVRCMHLHGNKVVSGSRDATLRVWNINDGSCLHILVGHLAAVRCVQYDGKLVVSGAYDYQVKVWNPEKQECLHTLQGHTNRVYSLQFDGVHVVSGSLDTSIRVWDAETGALRHTLMGHQSLTSGMELKNNILVSGNADSTVKVWDILTGQCLATLAGRNKHHSAVTCLQFNNRFVVTSSDDGTVKLWDVKTGEFLRNLVALESGGSGGVVWRIRANDTKLICAVGSRNGTEETKLMVLDFDVEGACTKCS